MDDRFLSIYNKFKQHGRPNSVYTKQIFKNDIKGVILSRLTLSSGGKPCWGGHDQIEMNWALPLSKVIKDSGKRVGVSFGGIGESIQDLSICLTIEQLEKIYIQVIDMYEIDHLDILTSITLPASTHGLNPTGMSIIIKAKDNQLDNIIINLITMGFYDDNWKNNMENDIFCVVKNLREQLNFLYPSLNDIQLYQRIAITPMIGKNHDTSILTVENAKNISFCKRE
ncbi:hypothetical protein RB653_004846 [Dictyostelium firmibasis]|uniref:Uncharacterized protein n=1 Tax=Dictyostelium firmibasis TaxID=79012 RepID=A0AAN7U8F2_9MYCE